MNFLELKKFYIDEIEKDFFPFWEKAFDYEYGGVFTCFNNQGTELVSQDKYTWSQGRFLWLLAHLYEMADEEIINLDKLELKEMADKTYRFLKENVFFDGYKCAFTLTRQGQQIEFDGVKDTSIFADTFVLISFNAYGRVFENKEALDLANLVLKSIKERLDTDNYRTEPYPIDSKFKAHSIPMIMSNCYEECLLTERQTDYRYDLDLEELLFKQIDLILNTHAVDDIVYELITDDDSYKDTLLYNHANPGHTIECMWFVLHGLDLLGKDEGLKDKARDIYKATYKLGWDEQDGGLLRFVDRRNGEKPAGRLIDDNFESLIIDTWDYKLWWPHSELLYTSLLVHFDRKDQEALEIYNRAHDYSFKTFPNPNKEIGEWIQIRDRQGQPVNKVVALPVKDPFHIVRNFILIIKLLEDQGY